MNGLGTVDQPLRVAIIGSGPAGFYAAEALFKAGIAAHIDMFDRLPTPFGLVRGGVAPDHAKIKSVTRVFDKIAATEGFAFWGNVMIGRDLTVDELMAYYDAAIFAYGAETDRRLGIPGEDLPGSHTATEFVGWYNAHPDYRDRQFDLSCETAVIIGQGNVAVDVCRILARPVDQLKQTDIARHALDAIAGSAIRAIYLIGRRGPIQAKFTTAELRELGHLAGCDVQVRAAELELDAASQTELDTAHEAHVPRNYAVLQEFAARPAGSNPKRIHIEFLTSPVRVEGADRVERVVFEKNRLEGKPFEQRASGTGVTSVLPCGIVFRSVGYRGLPLPGLPFDARSGTVPNQDGRVVDSQGVLPGLYVAGWIKRGPSGIIGTNKPDSAATVKSLIEDLAGLGPCPHRDGSALRRLLLSRGVRPVSYADWQAIDAAETARGALAGKSREKFVCVDEMIGLLDGASREPRPQ